MPSDDAAVSAFAPREALGSYFGIANVAWGMGKGADNLAGGSLMQYTLSSQVLWLLWALYAALGLTTGALYLLAGRLQPVEPETRVTEILLFRPGQPDPRLRSDTASLIWPGQRQEEAWAKTKPSHGRRVW
jgi:hypothetical protein